VNTPSLDSPTTSWFKPIFVGALFAAIGFATVTMVTPCCCGAAVLPAAVLPALIAWRDDTRMKPGHGFAVSFIAVGIGAILVATPMAFEFRKFDAEELRATLREQAAKSMGPDVSAADIDVAVEAMATIWPYTPLVGAVVLTVMAGLLGLVTVAMLRRRGPQLDEPR